MALTNPDHDQPHRSPAEGQTVDTVDQASSVTILGLAAAGAVAISVLHLAIG